MTPVELLALSLALSFATAALGLMVTRTLERRVPDPGLRERAWTAALYVPALPPLLIGLMLLAPPPVQTGAAADLVAAAPTAVLIELQSASGFPAGDLTQAASILVLVLAGLFAVRRAVSLGVRLMRLRRLIRATSAPSAELMRTVEQVTLRIGATVPVVRICGSGAEALLAGLLRPVLVLPASLAAAPAGAAVRAVCAHELAHLKRGDHRALWIEEALLAALAINPLLPVIRDYRAAAREETCDAAALAGATDHERRLYARSLIDAVGNAGSGRTAPVLTFTSARRTVVMNRLKAILSPASPAGPGSRRIALGLVAVIAGIAGSGSLAVAAQRQPDIVAERADATAPRQPALAAAATPVKVAPISPVRTERPAADPAVAQSPQPPPVIDETPAEATDRQQAAESAEITGVTWARHPTPRWPPLAAANGVTSGLVTLTCDVESNGQPSGCVVVTEKPEGNGFGEAALTSMEGARFSPAIMDTATPGARARFTIRFRLAE